MKGSTPPQIAEIIIKLVKDMAAVSSISFCISFFHKFDIKLRLALLFPAFMSSKVTKFCFLRATCQMLGPESPKTQLLRPLLP